MPDTIQQMMYIVMGRFGLEFQMADLAVGFLVGGRTVLGWNWHSLVEIEGGL